MFPIQSIGTSNVCAAQKRSKHGRDPYHVMWPLLSARMMTSRDETAPSVGGKVKAINEEELTRHLAKFACVTGEGNRVGNVLVKNLSGSVLRGDVT
ncbi:hypothetical protein CEXT_326681 [Caerostris extrusa]|uniref:Uncharacterized protein n=1 Tax=Caerostris extrusa TaxID=172846 RepID=A0AAV4N6D3_CAEEX|nr:hypothetical protein CEXT_326681 [Caerostris extrusa]